MAFIYLSLIHIWGNAIAVDARAMLGVVRGWKAFATDRERWRVRREKGMARPRAVAPYEEEEEDHHTNFLCLCSLLLGY